MITLAILGEEFPSKVAAEFACGDEARRAAEQLLKRTGISARQVRVIEPRDPAMERKLEPESAGIAKTLVRAHSILGVAGLLVGLVVASLLVLFAIQPFSSNPFYTLGVAGFFGGIAGLLLGGLVSLRPDHDNLITWVEDASRGGRWFVLVHAHDHRQEFRAKKALEAMSDKVVGTL
ncbi:MAG: hypothetical protein WA970_12805 [Gammaproteobacteria bacterium]